jgi:hypothetical protein
LLPFPFPSPPAQEQDRSTPAHVLPGAPCTPVPRATRGPEDDVRRLGRRATYVRYGTLVTLQMPSWCRDDRRERVSHFPLIQQVHFTSPSSSSASFLLRAWLAVETRAGLLVLMLCIHRVAAWHPQLPTYLPGYPSSRFFSLSSFLSVFISLHWHFHLISFPPYLIASHRIALNRISHHR